MQNSTLAHYRVSDKLGEGGMGEVWRARDTKLGRSVAIKLLPASFAQDKDRLERFEREARVLAAFSHPNIAAIYGLEEDGDQRFLVMEMADGEDLEARLSRGPLAIEDAVGIAIQIARAVEAAHEQGIVHRDLKPANIVVDARDQVKVLDFGLAKALDHSVQGDGDPSLSASRLDHSPTLAMSPSMLSPATSPAITAAGVLMGTAGYMSPEQARAKVVDRRADVWAFGCVLFEMLAGSKTFGGDTIADVLGAVVHKEPDWADLPASTPLRIRRLLERCLRKDVDRRLQSVGDARVLLQEWQENPEAADPAAEGAEAPPVSPLRNPKVWLLAGGAAAAALVAGLLWPRSGAETQDEPVRRFVATVADVPILNNAPSVTVSADGARVAFLTMDRSVPRLELRVKETDQFDVRTLTYGSDESTAPFQPFFSPDGQSVGFVNGAGMSRMSLRGEPPTLISAEIKGSVGGPDWGETGIVVAVDRGHRLLRVPSAGGALEVLLEADEHENAPGALHHLFGPKWLPGEQAIIFTEQRGQTTRISGLRIGSEEPVELIPGASRGRYLSSGHLAFWRGGNIFVQAFDAERLETSGAPAPMVSGVRGTAGGIAGEFDVSPNGMLVYEAGEDQRQVLPLMLSTRAGITEPLWRGDDFSGSPLFSPDGKSLLVARGTGDEWDLWKIDIETQIPTRVTFDAGYDADAVWSPDGSSIVYTSQREGDVNLFVTASDGRGTPEPLLEPGSYDFPSPLAWHPDGGTMIFISDEGLYELDLESREVTEFAVGEDARFLGASYSPDGGYVAYTSNESGRAEIYLRALDGPGKWQVTNSGAQQPRWSANGRELFFRTERGLEVVPIDFASGAPRWGRATVLFDVFGGETFVQTEGYRFDDYDIGPDGNFAVIAREGDQTANETKLHFVSGWLTEVRRVGATE